MKKFSIFLSVLLALASFFYGLSIISKDNSCTSVRKYSPECKPALTATSATVPIVTKEIPEPETEIKKIANETKVQKEITIDYALTSYILINTSSFFIGWYETWFEKIVDKWTYYEVIYSWKDKISVDIDKDKNKVMSVNINWNMMAEDKINEIFSKYYK